MAWVEEKKTPPTHRGLRVVGVLLGTHLVQAIVVLVARLASANSTHQLHELACVEIKFRAPHAIDATLSDGVEAHEGPRNISTQERTLRRADAVARAQVHVHKFGRAPRHRLEGVAPVREVDLFGVRVLGDVLAVKQSVI